MFMVNKYKIGDIVQDTFTKRICKIINICCGYYIGFEIGTDEEHPIFENSSVLLRSGEFSKPIKILKKDLTATNNSIVVTDILQKESEKKQIQEDNNSAVDHPHHYQGNKFEVIDIIEDYGLDFNLGNAIKYILRSGKKDKSKTTEDLNKAIWYIDRELGRNK